MNSLLVYSCAVCGHATGDAVTLRKDCSFVPHDKTELDMEKKYIHIK